ncbi:hypothetical protein NDU88_007100 [Pleurodeles waltl]|uniref:Uncharacterized protein n=1 Tax=Pleurodeles waltl TaxID=8319 RepID=A0AAV7MES4_PLEWA|nr:hypothetical protein NDU88_007100 [Pleurodeles waltl]
MTFGEAPRKPGRGWAFTGAATVILPEPGGDESQRRVGHANDAVAAGCRGLMTCRVRLVTFHGARAQLTFIRCDPWRLPTALSNSPFSSIIDRSAHLDLPAPSF